jgi:hypothetical protein
MRVKPIILVGKRIAQRPFNGGSPWVHLNWVLGFRQLGYPAYLIDQIEPESCVGDDGKPSSLEASINLAYFQAVANEFGLGSSSALVYADGKKVVGMSRADLLQLAESAELLINFGEAIRWPAILDRVRLKAYVDENPGFTQFGIADGTLEIGPYDYYFTYGKNIGTTGCPIPTWGLQWRTLWPSVLLAEWPVSDKGDPRRFTTVAAWRAQPSSSLTYLGYRLGVKADELRKVVDLPLRTPYKFEIALRTRASRAFLADSGGDWEVKTERSDLEELVRAGWNIVDPRVVVPDPGAYRSYIQSSGAEISVAKGVYVSTGCGWFSDRTICYLASGKPAIVQETGFSRTIPVGQGLLPFRTLDEAVTAAEEIAEHYEAHCSAARRIAEEHFDSARVIRRLLEEVGID